MTLALDDTVPGGVLGRYRALGPAQLPVIAHRYGLSEAQARAVRLHSMVLPFRVNSYVLDQLIDWSAVPEDPIYQLVFPQPGMLPASDLAVVAEQAGPNGSATGLRDTVTALRARLNPHPSGQQELNIPTVDGRPLAGVQYKYSQTVLYFPAQGQTCHAYCTYCFRWAQFVGDADLRFATPDPRGLVGYLAEHPGICDVLVTGGDPMIMSTMRLRAHLEPLLEVPTVATIRIGTKSLAYWPARFTTDPDADDLLRLFDKVIASGRTLAVMAHVSHPRELSTDAVREAIARIRSTGAVVYCQAPLMAYFEVPLDRAWGIFTTAFATLPGLARTVRGPVMSAAPGKVVVDYAESRPDGDPVLHLRFLQARDPRLVGRPFRARMRPGAAWLDDLDVLPGEPADIRAAVAGAVS